MSQCNYPDCDGGPATGYCHNDCRTSPRIIPCESCGSEGRIYEGYGNDPHPRDCGPCPVCEGTGGEIIEAEPVTLDDLHCTDCGVSLPLMFPCNEQYCSQRALVPSKRED